MRPRILLMIPSLVVAGAEKVVLDLADNLIEKGFVVGIISLSEEVPFYSRIKNKKFVQLYTCGEKTFRFPWFSWKRWILVLRAIKDFKPDVVHSHLWSFHCFYLLSLYNKRNRINFFHTVHITDSHYTNKEFIHIIFKKVEIATVKLLRGTVISISEPVHILCKEKLLFRDVRKISNGIDTKFFRPLRKSADLAQELQIPKNHKVLINVGRFDLQKGQVHIIEALKILKSLDNNEYMLLLVGRNVEQNLKTKVLDYDLQENVRFLGVCNRIPEFLAFADLGIFPSLYEGFGLACGEMMSCELPTIVSDIPPLLEITDNGNAAIVVPKGDSLAIAQAVSRLANDPVLQKKIGKLGRKFITDCFSLEKQVEKHIELYHE